MPRRIEQRPTKTFWIICEGQTEKNYFQKLKIDMRIGRVIIKPSENHDAIGIVKYAISFIRLSRDYQRDDMICCVFDRDANTEVQLQEAKRLAEQKGIRLIFSNPCFEYWLLIHFEYHPTACESEELSGMMKKYIPYYSKTDSGLYLKTKDRIATAINNAQRIASLHAKNGAEYVTRNSNPITLVHEIIKILEEFK